MRRSAPSRSPTAATRDGSYDLAIGNVPFGNMVLHDRRHNPAGHTIHNHFIIKALRLIRPGGLVAVLTSRYTMDARNPAARREIAVAGRPGRRDPAARRRPPAGRRHRRGDRPAGAAPPRARPPARPHCVGADPARPSWTAPRCRSTSTSWTTRRWCSARWAPCTAPTGPMTWWSAHRRHDRRTVRRAQGADRWRPAARPDLRTCGPRHGDPLSGSRGTRRAGAARRVPARPAGRHVHQDRLRH